jgi:hypothetical protein
VRHAAQLLREAKLAAKKIKLEKEKQALSATSIPIKGDDRDSFGFDEKPTRAKPTRIDAWQQGNRYARQEKTKWLELVTVDTLPEIMPRLKRYGFCILNNMKNIFSRESCPCAHQRDYILKVTQADLLPLFEGAIWN